MLLQRTTLAVLVVLLLAPAAFAHGGSWRGPGGITPGARIPSDPFPHPTMPGTPPATGPVATPGTEPSSGGPVALPGQPTGGGPIATPGSTNPGAGGPIGGGITGGVPTPNPRTAPVGPSGPTSSHWIFWWNLNRERILSLRELQAKRVRARTAATTPHFLGEGGEGNVRDAGIDEAREQILVALLRAAKDPHPDVATGAIIALGKSKDVRAAVLLRDLVDAKRVHSTVPELAALALGMLGFKSPEIRTFLAEVAADRKRPRRTRAFAALGLGFLGDVGAIPALMDGWHGKEVNNEVPASSLMALGLLGDEIVVPDLTTALTGRPDRRERDDHLRAHTATALGMIRSRAGLIPLVNALRDPDKEVRRQAVLSIGALARPEDVRVLKTLMLTLAKDKDDQTRAFAAVSLGETGSPAAADALLYSYRKGNTMLVPYAALGLALLARNADQVEVRERIVPFLRAQFLERKNNDLRGALAIALGIVRDENSVPALRKLLMSRSDPLLRGHAAMALGLIGRDEVMADLRRVLSDGRNPDVQREVALALALIGDREASSILVSLVKNGKTEYVRGSAAVALGRLADARTALAMVEVLEDRRSPDTTRAFMGVALGLVLDQHEVPLLSRIGEHYNHRMVVASLAEVLTFL